MPGRFPGESLLRQRWMCPCDNQRVQTCPQTASLCLEQYPTLSVYKLGNINERCLFIYNLKLKALSGSKKTNKIDV